jgi:heme-degrading monooxygenase HmoA
MPEIGKKNGIVTQITTVKVPPDNQDEVLKLMTERAHFMATQPGFISITLHRSEDGTHVVNYIQWKNRKQLEAAHHSPEFRKRWPRFGEIAEEIDPVLYDVIHVEAEARA